MKCLSANNKYRKSLDENCKRKHFFLKANDLLCLSLIFGLDPLGRMYIRSVNTFKNRLPNVYNKCKQSQKSVHCTWTPSKSPIGIFPDFSDFENQGFSA